MASVPQEQLIIDQVVTWLQQITHANGYHTEIGGAVYTEEWRRGEQLAASLTVIDTEYAPAEPGKWRMTLDVEGVFPRVKDERAIARRLLQDIARSLFQRIGIWREIGAGVTRVVPSAKLIERVADSSDFQRVVYSLDIEYSGLTDKAA